MSEDCLFCKIVAGVIPSRKVYEDDDSYAFQDINPQAPTHVLVIPKKHLADIGALSEDAAAAHAVLKAIKAVASQAGADHYRTVFNTGSQVGQSVFHVHAHVLGGRPMSWPPG